MHLLTPRSFIGKPGAAAAAQSLGAKASKTAICHFWQVVLGNLATALAKMETGADPRPTGDGHSLAPCWLQVVLDVAFAASSERWKKMCQQGTSRPHLPHGH